MDTSDESVDTSELERYSASQLRDPKNSSTGGQFTSNPASPNGWATANYSPQAQTGHASSGGGGGGKAAAKKESSKKEPGEKPAPSASQRAFKTLAFGQPNDTKTVTELQQLLRTLGYSPDVTGTYDDKTRSAVQQIQRRLGLPDNGNVNTGFKDKLLAAYDLSPCIKRSDEGDCDDSFTVTRSEDDVFDTLRESTEDEDVERADPSMPYGDVTYADPGYQSDGVKRYPLDSEEHCRAAWSYINQKANAAKYTPEQLAEIKARILKAGKEYGIDFAVARAQPREEEHTPGHAPCCPDVLDDEAHVFRREWTLDGIDIIRSGQGGDGRTVEAYATVFDSPTEVKDQHGHYMETIDRAAFDDVLRGGIGRVKVFYNHGMHLNGTPSDRWSVPIGTPVEVRADGKGLRTITRFNQGADGDQVLEAIRNGAVTGYSFRGPIRQSNPPRIPRARDGQPLPEVRRMKLGLTEYGPTPMPYYAGANVLALRSRLSTLDPDKWDRLVEFLSTSTPEDQEALRTAITATPDVGPGAEDQPAQALRSAEDIARRIRVARILKGIP